jgi:hypothetical protein
MVFSGITYLWDIKTAFLCITHVQRYQPEHRKLQSSIKKEAFLYSRALNKEKENRNMETIDKA